MWMAIALGSQRIDCRVEQSADGGLVIYSDESSEIGEMLVRNFGFHKKSLADAPQSWHLASVSNKLLLCHPETGRVQLTNADLNRRMASGRRLLLARACGFRHGLRVHDAYAGWGSDGLVLARLGAVVSMTELSGIVHAMLFERCLRLGLGIEPLRMNAADWIRDYGNEVDVVYLDPLFPERRKTAKPSLRMQALAAVGEESNPLEAFFIARDRVRERVVVKRRRHDAELFPHPNWKISGSKVRFDVYRSTAH